MNVRTDVCNESGDGWRNLGAGKERMKEGKTQHEDEEWISEKKGGGDGK